MKEKDTKGKHHFMSVLQQSSSWHQPLFVLRFTCGINKGDAQRETGKAWK